jgi:hypothetical protein
LGHGRVAGQGDGGNIFNAHAGSFDNFFNDLIDGLDDDLVEFIESTRFLRKHDSGNNIITVADLPVEFAMLCQYLPANEIDHLTINRCRADIHGNRITLIGGIAGLNIDDTGFTDIANRSNKSRRYFEIVRTQNFRNFPNNRDIDFQTMLIMFEFQMADQSGDIRQIILGCRSGNFKNFFSTGGTISPCCLSSSKLNS